MYDNAWYMVTSNCIKFCRYILVMIRYLFTVAVILDTPIGCPSGSTWSPTGLLQMHHGWILDFAGAFPNWFQGRSSVLFSSACHPLPSTPIPSGGRVRPSGVGRASGCTRVLRCFVHLGLLVSSVFVLCVVAGGEAAESFLSKYLATLS